MMLEIPRPMTVQLQPFVLVSFPFFIGFYLFMYSIGGGVAK